MVDAGLEELDREAVVSGSTTGHIVPATVSQPNGSPSDFHKSCAG
jgi:hypothetical protein